MSVLVKGKTGPILSNERRVYRPGVGWETRRTYTALTKPAIYALARPLINAGWQVEFSHVGPKWTCEAMKTGAEDGGAETPLTRWTYRKELLQRSIWTMPSVIEEAEAYATATGNRADYKKTIEGAVSDGDELSLNSATYPVAHLVYFELCRGTDSYETDYIVLSRDRIVTPDYVSKLAVGTTRVVYTTSALIASSGPAYDCPADITAILPSAGSPATVTGSTWGWRTRGNDGIYESYTRFTERSEWVFAPWSNFLYDVD